MGGIERTRFLAEMSEYAKKLHAKIVYIKCIKNGKLELAEKISKKYELTNYGNDIFCCTNSDLN